MKQNIYVGVGTVVPESSFVGPFSVIGNNSKIGENVEIGSHVCISDNVIIGDNCVIADMVSICENVEIGENTFIETGVAFVKKLNQRAKDISTAHKTFVGKNVSIHAKAVIEAGAQILDNTVIGYDEVITA